MCDIVDNIGQDSSIPVRRRMLIMVNSRHVLATLNSQKESEYPHTTFSAIYMKNAVIMVKQEWAKIDR